MALSQKALAGFKRIDRMLQANWRFEISSLPLAEFEGRERPVEKLLDAFAERMKNRREVSNVSRIDSSTLRVQFWLMAISRSSPFVGLGSILIQAGSRRKSHVLTVFAEISWVELIAVGAAIGLLVASAWPESGGYPSGPIFLLGVVSLALALVLNSWQRRVRAEVLRVYREILDLLD
jgi:hypothetical protein